MQLLNNLCCLGFATYISETVENCRRQEEKKFMQRFPTFFALHQAKQFIVLKVSPGRIFMALGL